MPDKQGIMNYTWIQRIKAAHRNQIPKFFYFFLVSALLVLTTCTEEQVSHREYPRVKTLDVTNISERGATFNAEVYSEGNDPIIEHGFVWGTTEGSLSLSASNRVMLGAYQGGSFFEENISTTLEKGKTYFVRAFVKTESLVIYGITVSFESLGSDAPEITSFQPKKAGWGDTLTIKGKNFSWQSNTNKLYFGNVLANSVTGNNQSDTMIYAIVPTNLIDSASMLSVELAGNKSTFTQDTFILEAPFISSIEPLIATWGETISIFGFFPKWQSLAYSVYFSNTSAQIESISEDKIVVKIPMNLITVNSSIKIIVNGLTVNSSSIFQLKPPEVGSVSASYVWSGCMFSINGKYFKQGHTTVKLKGVNASIYEITDKKIVVTTPNLIFTGNFKLSVTVLDQTTEWENLITYFVPKITSVTPSNVTYNDTIHINGNFYYNNINELKVKVGQSYMPILYASSDVIKVLVPELIYLSNLSVTVEGPWGQVSKANAFNIISPEIHSLSATEGKRGDVISIYGDYFNPNLNYNNINIGSVVYASRNRIDFVIGYVSSGLRYVILTGPTYNTTVIVNNFLCYSPFKRLKDTYLNFKTTGFFGVYSGLGYYGRGNYVYRYNPADDSWSTMIELSNDTKYQAFFSIGSKLFSVCGQDYNLTNRVIMYDMENNTVKQLNDFPYERGYSFGFSINGKGYIGGGYNSYNGYNPLRDFWEYNVEKDEWVRKKDLPSSAFNGSACFVIEGKAYVLENNMKLWCYDPDADVWESRSPLPVITSSSKRLASSFTINGLGYIACGSDLSYYYPSKEIWEYNPVNDNWVRKYDFPGYAFSHGVCFVFDEKAYLGLGKLGYSNNTYQFFEYDPSLDQ